MEELITAEELDELNSFPSYTSDQITTEKIERFRHLLDKFKYTANRVVADEFAKRDFPVRG